MQHAAGVRRRGAEENVALALQPRVETRKGFHIYFAFHPEATMHGLAMIDVQNDGQCVFYPPTKYTMPAELAREALSPLAAAGSACVEGTTVERMP